MNSDTFMVPIAPATTTSQSAHPTDDIQRKKRTRAKRSCDLCRKKKTRCDAVGNQPCSKCRLAKTDCLFLVEQKKRGPSSGSYVEVLENRLLRMEKLIRTMNQEKQVEQESGNSSEINSEKQRYPGLFLHDNDNKPDEEEHNAGFGCPVLAAQTELNKTMSRLTISDYQRTRYIGASSGVHFLGDTLLQSGQKHRIPHEPSWFVQKLNDDEDEHVIMKSKEILSPTETHNKDEYVANRIELFQNTPHLTQELVDYLIDVYFTRVHIYSPIINKTQFLEQYYYHNPTPPDKYLLYSITLIGLAIYSPEVKGSHQFTQTKEDIAETYQDLKVKIHKLLSILYKRSMISTVQTLMLMSMFVGHDNDDDEDTGHWFITGMAIRMAQDLGLHRDCSKWDIPDYEIELRKRIWYTAYMMDRWVAAELGRPVSILDHEFDVELPNEFELNSPPLHQGETTPILVKETEQDRIEKKPVYACFSHLITLSQIAGQVLVGFHSTRAKKYRFDNLALLDILDRSLTNWKLALPESLKWDATSGNLGMLNPTAYILNMACDCVWILLYRPFIKTNQDQLQDSSWAVKALSKCTTSAINLISTAECMEHHSFVALPWNMAIYAVFQAAIIFLYNAKGDNELIREQGRMYLRRCTHLYNRDPYLRTTRVVKVLQQYMANFEIYMDEGNTPPLPQSEYFTPNSDHMEFTDESLNTMICPTSIAQATSKQNTACPDSLIASSVLKSTLTNNSPVVEKQDPFNPFSDPNAQNTFLSSLSFDFDLQQQRAQEQETYDVCSSQTQQPQPPQPFDITSLSSEIPIWELPSGITWNEWESFLKSNV